MPAGRSSASGASPGIRVGRDGGAGLELGFGLLVLEVLLLCAPGGVLRFHLGGDVGLHGLVGLSVCMGAVRFEQRDGGFGEE